MARNQIRWNRYDTVYCQKSSHCKGLCKALETASHNICCQISLLENLPTSHAVDEHEWGWDMQMAKLVPPRGPTTDGLESRT